MEYGIESPRSIQFEDFELDLRAGQLRKAGVKLKLTGQPLLVLAALLERPGDVVTRDELQKKLWPDTFVDVDHNLNTAINKIREALGDSAESPRYVETVPRRGYRFVGELKFQEEPVAVAVEPVPQTNLKPQSFRGWLRLAVCIAVVAVIVMSVVIAYRWARQANIVEKEAPLARPFTALPGIETNPAFSPDGSRIAFAWNGDPASGGKGFDLYVKAIGSETMLRLTQHPSEWLSPTWSPDGTQIAFHRMAGVDTGIYIVPALGGPERKVRSTVIPTRAFLSLSWSPDGKWIGFTEFEPGSWEKGNATVSLLSTETGEARRLPNPPQCTQAVSPHFSHSGEALSYLCVPTGADVQRLYVESALGGTPKLVSTIAYRDGPIVATSWSRDDRALIYSHLGKFNEVSVSDGSVMRLEFAADADFSTLSPKSDALAYTAPSFIDSLWRRDLLHPESPATSFVPTTRWEGNPEYSPDGKHIAFSSERSGVQGVWVSSDDGSNLVEISNPLVPSGSPEWSPDGRQIAFDAYANNHWGIYIAEVSERIPRKVAMDISAASRPSWSRDGKWIYFVSSQVQRSGPFRCLATGGNAIALSKDTHGSKVRESFDARTAYFASWDSNTGLREVGLESSPGTATDVERLPHLLDWDSWALTPAGLYFISAEDPRSLRFLDFTTKQTRTLFRTDKDFGQGLSVSPDGHWILYAQQDVVGSDIMLVEHFH